jgi:OOP family OmpA-OmpF porin
MDAIQGQNMKNQKNRLGLKGFALSACLVSAGALTLPLSAMAEEAENGNGFVSHFSVLGSYIRADSDRGARVDEATGIVIQYGRQYQSRLGWEAMIGTETIETRQSGMTDFYRHFVGGQLTYAFTDRSGFTPFLLIGGGANYNDVQAGLVGVSDGWDAFGTAGIGFVTAPLFETERFRIRGEIRYVYDDFDTGMQDYRANLGVEIPMFKRAEPMEIGMQVEERVQVVEAELVDSDGDGVPDIIDECPGTPRGTRVDPVGCPLGDTLLLDGVVFEFDSARLQLNARRLLDPVVLMFQRYPDLEAEVAGHTDSIGSAEYNRDLSERRANAVRDYLIANGVSASLLTARGYGLNEPVADNSTEEGREQNRRVELRILN